MSMGAHTAVNGHRGEDGAATAPVITPLIIPPALGPVSPWPPVNGHGKNAATTEEVPWWRKLGRLAAAHGTACLAAVPVVLVNAVAFGAQLGFWRVHVPLVAEAVLVALALESIAIYLAWQAHLAQLADDSALRLRLSAYGMALGIGALNYSHFDGPGWRPTVPAVTFGMMSAISPWLWSVHSRRVSRDALKERGLIEPHAVRLGATRWQWHPVRSVRVMSAATWTGETDPAAAIATWQPHKIRKASPEAAADVSADVSPDAADDRQEGISDEVSAPLPPASPDQSPDAAPKPRKRAATPTARSRALAALKANPGMSDAEAMKFAKASRATVQRARATLKETS